MWLLEFHFSFSILCLLTFIGLVWIGKERMNENGWLKESKKRSYFHYLLFFLPLVNLLILGAVVIMIAMSKEEVEKYLEKDPEENSEDQI